MMYFIPLPTLTMYDKQSELDLGSIYSSSAIKFTMNRLDYNRIPNHKYISKKGGMFYNSHIFTNP